MHEPDDSFRPPTIGLLCPPEEIATAAGPDESPLPVRRSQIHPGGWRWFCTLEPLRIDRTACSTLPAALGTGPFPPSFVGSACRSHAEEPPQGSAHRFCIPLQIKTLDIRSGENDRRRCSLRTAMGEKSDYLFLVRSLGFGLEFASDQNLVPFPKTDRLSPRLPDFPVSRHGQ